MPVSRGRGRRNRPKKPRQHTRTDRSESRITPDSIPETELNTVEMIARVMVTLPKQPSCTGPLVVHSDGAYECHGPHCPGATTIYHSDDAVEPCQIHPELQLCHPCPRCLVHADNPQMIEHACSGLQLEHDDGTMECANGDACLGDDILHVSSQSCRFAGPCPRDCQPV